MIKPGFMSCIAPAWSFDRLTGVATMLGYAGIEFRVGAHQQHGIEPDTATGVIKAKRQHLAQQGLEASALATSIMLAAQSSPEYRADLAAEVERHARLAAEIGAPLIRVSARAVTEEGSPATLAEHLGLATEQAAKYGVVVALETTAGLTSAKATTAVVQQANHPNAGILWDVYHTSRVGESLEESFRLVQPYLKHLHLNQLSAQARRLALSRPAPVLDYPRLFRLLETGGYSGFVSGEWLGIAESEAFELLKTNRQLLNSWLEEAKT
jgi:sugar phosphate isomerase/epimerase